MLYYAHSLRKYNNIEEKKELELIKKHFGEQTTIFNPNCQKVSSIGREGSIMRYLLNLIRKEIDILVFSTYCDFIGRGVYDEIMAAKDKKIPIFIIKDGKVEKYDSNQIKLLGINWAIQYAQP